VSSDVEAPSAGDGIARIAELLHSRRTLVLSGAGISTDSGIPDYRGPSSKRRKGGPIQYREFMASPETRARYWARSTIGWPSMRRAEPNDSHRAVARLEQAGYITGVITQNVDGLHQAAGSSRVLELHGALAEVQCLSCGTIVQRDRLQDRLLQMNPGWESHVAEIAPDGDAELPEELARSFRVPVCPRCAGILKPNVVFFGENVPKTRVQQAWSMLAEAEALLVLGSSLTVFSGFRFVDRAAKEAKPVAIINRGRTRGDSLATVRIDAGLDAVVSKLAETVLARDGKSAASGGREDVRGVPPDDGSATTATGA
jgi:NAD-dependent SIR2 family protein deacetylase